MNNDSVKYLRHEIRTYLNHIIGYAEILHEDLRDLSHPELLPEVQNILEEAEGIKRVFTASFYQSDGQAREDFDPKLFKQSIFGPLYIVIGLVQRLKTRCEDDKADFLVPDIIRILDSSRKMLDLVEQGIKTLNFEPMRNDAQYNLGSDALSTSGLTRKDDMLGKILVVDDNEMNRDLLVRHLERQGHKITAADNGYKALQLLKEETFDLVLLDIMMPGMNGYQVLEKLKEDPGLRHIPVIMISALEEMDSVAHCISLGAEDYLPKSFDPLLLKARINSCLGKKHYRDQERKYMQALLESQQLLEKELAEAADYVRGLLPPPLAEGPVQANWIFKPSAKLGGDCFDYHWLDDRYMAVYLLDVSGHGIGAALLSVSVMNLLRSRGLPHTDFHDPTEVLHALNENFQMENQNNMYFTIWYGIYDSQERTISYASGGAPPAYLVQYGPQGVKGKELSTVDMIIGVDMDYQYETKVCKVEPDSRLYLFSDGVYEIRRANGKMLVFKEFADILTYQPNNSDSNVQSIFNQVQGLALAEHLDDDFSLLEVRFS